jgi:hypothetical protein
MEVEERVFSFYLLSYRNGNIVMTMYVKLSGGYYVNAYKISTKREDQC